MKCCYAIKLEQRSLRFFCGYSSLTIRKRLKNFDWIYLSLLWLWSHVFINKNAEFPSDTQGDARKDLYDEWVDLLDCIDSYHKRLIFALYRFREAIMIGYDYNRTGILATIRKSVRAIQTFFLRRRLKNDCNEFFIK